MRLGIVSDLAASAELLTRLVDSEPSHRVVWIAKHGDEAVAFCARDTPDLILMDIVMPGMRGGETTRRIMTSTPCAILIVSGSVRLTTRPIFEAMGHGALDAIDLPLRGGGKIEERAAPLLAKIASISRLVGSKPGTRRVATPGDDFAARRRQHRLIAIGASAGGPAVLATLLHHLPKSFPAAVVIVQHVDEKFAAGMAAWLDQSTALSVRVAAEGDRPTAGEVLLAATRDHLALKTADRVGYTADPIDYLYRPSVDVFFHSACRFWPGEMVGVLLTGMGRDGALGLKALRNRGHYTIAQDEATSAVFGMPKAAASLDAAVDVLPAARIAQKLIEVTAER